MKRIGSTFTTSAACCRARSSPGRSFLSSHVTTTASTSTSLTSLEQPEAITKKLSFQGRPAKLGSAAGITTSAKCRAAQVSIPKSNVQNVEGLGEEKVVKAATKLGARVLTLNRPKALNALNKEMIGLMQPLLEGWEQSSSCKLIIFKGEGRAFCAGGDVKALVNLAKDASTRQQAIDFFLAEYTLDRYIALMKKPVIAFLDGHTIGGGVGISIHAPFRIATEKTVFSMPETSIGLFPDVGANFFLSRLDGQLGTYLGLTGAQVQGYDVFRAGIATHYVPSDRLEALEERLSALEFPADAPSNTVAGQQLINACIEEFAADADVASVGGSSAFPDGAKRSLIDACFDQPRVSKILSALVKVRDANIELSGWAGETIEVLEFLSPTSLSVALEAIREGKSHDINQAFEYDLRLASVFCNPEVAPDFLEGVMHRLGGDKETQAANRKKRAKWSPASISDIKHDHIRRTFFSSGSNSKATVSLPALPAGTKSYKSYPHAMFALPTEDIIGRVVKGDVKDSGSFAVTEKEVFEWFEREWNSKIGVKEKVAEVLKRKTQVATDGTLQWK